MRSATDPPPSDSSYSRQDDDLIRLILRNPVKSIDKLRMIVRREHERPTVAVKSDHQPAVGVPRQREAAIGSEVVSLQCLHSMLLSSLLPQHAWLFARIPRPVTHGGRCSVCCWRGGVWRNTERRRHERAEKPRPRRTYPMLVR